MSLEAADRVYLRVWNGMSAADASRGVGSCQRVAFHGKPSASVGTRCMCDGCRARRGLLPLGKRQAVFGR